MRKKLSAKGSSIVELLLVIASIAALSFAAWFAWRHTHDHKTSARSGQSTHNSAALTQPDAYAGWKTASSPRAKFSIRYPASWSYYQTVGDKDGVEHMTIDSATIHLTIDSYTGKNGDVPGTICADCTQTVSSLPFAISRLGKAKLDTVTYRLDAASGNALIVRQADDTYYIPSSTALDVYTTFRAISNLSSEAAYQQETLSDFTSNADYATAQKILESIAY